MRFALRYATPTALLLGSAIFACTENELGPPAPSVAGGIRQISFQARVGAAPFSCATPITGAGITAATVEPLDFRLYVHDVRLVRDDGSEEPFLLESNDVFQTSGVALLDFEDKSGTCANGTTETNTVLRGRAGEGVYTGVRFRIGVPTTLNHQDVAAATSPLNLSTLFWSWTGGYKFARIDVRPTGMAGMDAGGMDMDAATAMDGGGTHGHGDGAFNIHLGSTDCTGDPAAETGVATTCARGNRGDVELSGFDPFAKPILVDLLALVATTDLSMDQGGAPGCMSGATDPECTEILRRLGVNPDTGEGDASGQALFRVE